MRYGAVSGLGKDLEIRLYVAHPEHVKLPCCGESSGGQTNGRSNADEAMAAMSQGNC